MSALTGRVVDQYADTPIAGASVKYGAYPPVQTDAEGRFTVAGVADATVRALTISKTGHYTRITRTASNDRDWEIVASSFPMAVYDDVARQEYGASTIAWVSHPTVYVDTRTHGFSHADAPKWAQEMAEQAPYFIERWTRGLLHAAAVILTPNPPADLSPGTIIAHMSERDADYWNMPYIGAARRSTLSNRTIVGGAVHIRAKKYATNPGKRKGILAHELGHVLGFGHMSGTVKPSLMQPSLGSRTDLLAFDHLIAELSYSREPGTTSPDNYGGSTGGKPQRKKRAAGAVDEAEEEPREVKVKKWVCGHPDKEKD